MKNNEKISIKKIEIGCWMLQRDISDAIHKIYQEELYTDFQ